MGPSDNPELKALITLLEDPDEEVFSHVSRHFLELGPTAVPALEKLWEVTTDEHLQEKLEWLIQYIQTRLVEKNLEIWVAGGGDNLLEGAFHVARLQYPEITYAEFYRVLDDIRQDIWLELNPHLTALEKVRIINHFLYDIYKFSPNTLNFYAPQNSFINQVLESRKGNPVSLGIIYICLAHMLEIPIYGVNLPRNFVLAYLDEFASPSAILFYINPYNRGIVLGRKEIDLFLKQLSIEPQPSFYEPCTNIDILQRLLLSIIQSFEKLGYAEKIKAFQRLFHILRDESNPDLSFR